LFCDIARGQETISAGDANRYAHHRYQFYAGTHRAWVILLITAESVGNYGTAAGAYISEFALYYWVLYWRERISEAEASGLRYFTATATLQGVTAQLCLETWHSVVWWSGSLVTLGHTEIIVPYMGSDHR